MAKGEVSYPPRLDGLGGQPASFGDNAAARLTVTFRYKDGFGQCPDIVPLDTRGVEVGLVYTTYVRQIRIPRQIIVRGGSTRGYALNVFQVHYGQAVAYEGHIISNIFGSPEERVVDGTANCEN